jgi:flagellin-like hook-associated protein FlgL
MTATQLYALSSNADIGGGTTFDDLTGDAAAGVASINSFINGPDFRALVEGDTAITDTTPGISALVASLNELTGITGVTATGLAGALEVIRGEIRDALPTAGANIAHGQLSVLTGGTAPTGPTQGNWEALADLLNTETGRAALAASVRAESPVPIDMTVLRGIAGFDAARSTLGLNNNQDEGTWGHGADNANDVDGALAAWLQANNTVINNIINGRSPGTIAGVVIPPRANAEGFDIPSTSLPNNAPMAEGGDPLLTRADFRLQVGPDTAHTINVDVQRAVRAIQDSLDGQAQGDPGIRGDGDLGSFGTRMGDSGPDLVFVEATHGAHAWWNNQIEVIDNFLGQVNELRAALGAYQNRLEFTIENADIASENLSASESRIRDADMAAEMMRLTQANVLQQAATAMLAQANQAPQSILQLLG